MTELRLYDNTRISDFRRCPRYFLFRHVLNWVPDSGPSLPLVFGGSWHNALDALWQGVKSGLQDDEVVANGHLAFVQEWIKGGMPHPTEIDISTETELAPRTPGNAMEMLYGYLHERRAFIERVELLEIERPFAVPLDPLDDKLFYVGRIDKVVRASGTIRGIEHKTTTASKKDGNDYKIRPLFMESFSPNSQVDGYQYALHLLYPGSRSFDVWVDAALVHKMGEDFRFIPVERKMEHLDGWLHDTRSWIDRIEIEKQRLDNAGPQDRYLPAFPKNTNSCFDFNTACPFLPLCKSRANPLSWTDVPPGYKGEKWDPLEHIGTPKELQT